MLRTKAQAEALWILNRQAQINPPAKKKGKIIFLGIRRKDAK